MRVDDYRAFIRFDRHLPVVESHRSWLEARCDRVRNKAQLQNVYQDVHNIDQQQTARLIQ